MVLSSENHKITYKDHEYINTDEMIKTKLLPLTQNELVHLSVKSARILAEGSDVKKVIEITLDNSKRDVNFSPGDTIGVFPENDPSDVDNLLERLNIMKYADLSYEISNKEEIPMHIPCIGSLRFIFTHFIDIRRFLSKTLITKLLKYTDDENERCSIENLCKNSKFFIEHVVEKHLSIIDFLTRFTSCLPPVTILMEHLPKITPRPYSISNSYKINPDEIVFCFSIDRFGDDKKNFTPGWFERILNKNKLIQSNRTDRMELVTSKIEKIDLTLENGMTKELTIPLYLRPPAFFLPVDHDTPVIIICNGTGISPFIGYIDERRLLVGTQNNFSKSPIWIYYGCRYSDEDYLYKEKLQNAYANNFISKLTVAHSRENHQRKYVQDCLREDKDDIIRMFKLTPVVHVCGSNSMVKEVELYFVDILKNINSLTEKEAKNSLKDLKKNNKFIVDVWT